MLLITWIFGTWLGLAKSAPLMDFYTTKYEHIDVDSILNNKRLVANYALCMLSKGPCTPDGLEFKRILPEAIQTNCARCTDKQKVVTLRAIKRLSKEYPKIFKQLEAIWDPDGIYIEKFVNTFDVHGLPTTTTTTTTTTAASTIITTTIPATTAVPDIFNRFGEDSNEVSGSANNFATYLPAGVPDTTTRRTTTSTTPSTTRFTTTVSTRPGIITSASNNFNLFSTTKPRPTGIVATNLQATVSLGTNLVGGLVKGLSNIGIKVLDTGVQITEMVIRGVQAVVSPTRYY